MLPACRTVCFDHWKQLGNLLYLTMLPAVSKSLKLNRWCRLCVCYQKLIIFLNSFFKILLCLMCLSVNQWFTGVLLWRTCIGSSGQCIGFFRCQAAADLRDEEIRRSTEKCHSDGSSVRNAFIQQWKKAAMQLQKGVLCVLDSECQWLI